MESVTTPGNNSPSPPTNSEQTQCSFTIEISGEKTGWVYNYLGVSLQQQAFDSKLCDKRELGTALDIVILRQWKK